MNRDGERHDGDDHRNLTADPELRFTPNGVAVANFTIASTHRFQQDGTWTDGDTVFLGATVWRTQAEQAAEHLARGSRVIATGRLRQRSYETEAGERRTVTELEVDELGASMRFPARNRDSAREDADADSAGI